MRNYATDPTTKEYVDKLNIFILPSVNPDGGHYAFHDGSVQRKNMKMFCNDPEAFTVNPNTGTVTTFGAVGNRGAWGVDLNRNNTVGTLFDGYEGASSTCTSETFTGPSEASEAEIKNEHWVADTFKNIKFANNIHTHGGYFMWAPGSYIFAGRQTLPAPNIGIEKYFFEVADTILSHIRSHRNTAILPQRVGPIADVLDSAAGNSADEQYYKRGIIAYSFEAGAQRITVNQTTGAISRQAVGFQPCFAGPGTNGGQGATCTTGNPPVPNPLMVNEGHDSTMEFAEGNFGMIQGALEYHEDTTAPQTTIEYSAAQTAGEPINFRFNWVGEPSVIHYTTDGTTPVKVPDDPATLALSLGTGAAFAPFTPGIAQDYTASTTANVISTAGNATLSVSDQTGNNPGHLMSNTFKMPQPLQATASSLGGVAAAGGAISAAPLSLLTYGGPVSNDSVTLSFKQSIGRTDALRTGTCSKTLTFTLSTTQP